MTPAKGIKQHLKLMLGENMPRPLDITKGGTDSERLMSMLKRKVVGQDQALQVMVDIYEAYQAGFSEEGKPAGNALFLGPTGVGKTATVEAVCKALFGNERACIKIDCAEFQHSHEIAKLIGSPPGYLGHRETHPMFTQEALARYHTEKVKLSVVLFDEIEKASDALWALLLGILDKAVLTDGTNKRVDFSKVIIIMTSNLGADNIQKLTQGGMGFASQQVLEAVLDSQIEEAAKQAAKKKFTPEFFNRLNHITVFKTLSQDHMETILSIELGNLQTRLLFQSKVKFFFHVRKPARDLLLREGYDKSYGARHIKRAIDNRITVPLARLVASGQIGERDLVLIDYVEGKEDLSFSLGDYKQ